MRSTASTAKRATSHTLTSPTEVVFVTIHKLRRQCRASNVQQILVEQIRVPLTITHTPQSHRMVHCRRLQCFASRSLSQTPTIQNHHRVDLRIDQLLRLTQQLACKHHNTFILQIPFCLPRCSITNFLVLNTGQITKNLRSWVVHIN